MVQEKISQEITYIIKLYVVVYKAVTVNLEHFWTNFPSQNLRNFPYHADSSVGSFTIAAKGFGRAFERRVRGSQDATGLGRTRERGSQEQQKQP